jgi:hypothetical protein
MHSRKRISAVWLSVLGLIAAGGLCAAPGDDNPRPAVDFGRDVYPVLRRACFDCHGPDNKQGKLRLHLREDAFKGGKHGAVIVPGKADKSELYRRIILTKDSDDVMPARGELLAKADIERIRDWINQGAVWPDSVKPGIHWAYVKPVRAKPPAVKNAAWVRNAIDAFILARLEKEKLGPSPEADRAALIRRLSLDLIGLPPSPAEVDAFLADDSPAAYEKLVDRLLASPHFGERWARPWLDLARYADSHGFQRDDLREMWPYRDWVIRALNADMPFDRFTIEQIAGDLLPRATVEQKIATGFHRCPTTNVEAGSEPEETRVNQVLDRVNTTAAVWLGSTLECCQCHKHKYDPFTQKDYYQLFAYFNSTALEADRSNPKVPGSIRFLGPTMQLPDQRDGQRKQLAADLVQMALELEARRRELAPGMDRWEKEAVANLGKARQTHPLDVADFSSTAGTAHKVLKDRSVLLSDDPPDKDTYVITVHTKLKEITGFQLEVLTDDSLPGKGPGRGDAQRPNFVLNTFAVKAAPQGSKDPAQPIKLDGARADFSQKGYEVAGAIGDNPKTGWAIAPQFHRPHWAIFDVQKPAGFAEGTTLTFTLVQEFGRGRVIGRLRLSALTGDRNARPLPADVTAILRTAPEKRTAAQKARLADHRLDQDEIAAGLKERQAGAKRALDALRPATALVMQELPQPRKSAIFKRGNYLTPDEPVQPGTPAVLHKLAPESAPTRLGLARWLVDRDNPLVARVTVNRWWAELFGRGIVSTVEDFGIKGEPPTHPELLDWLAVDFMDNGWSMKKVLKQIVMSATYRQSARLTAELRACDDQNKLHARGPRFRMDAEMIRDNALAAAGLLSKKQFGPPVRPYQPEGLWNKIGGDRVEYVVSPGEDRQRRGIYVVWKRGAPYPSFVSFDATARLACTVKRSRSNTPLQALTLLNDPVYVEAAMGLAKRVLTEEPKARTDERLRHAFRLCLMRAPSDRELQTLRRLHDAQCEASRSDAVAARELVAGLTLPSGVSAEEFAAWYAVATTLLNLDEMITKG